MGFHQGNDYKKRLDLEGQKFNKWTVLNFSRMNNGTSYWLCKCECGTIREVCGRNLNQGITTSCGCSRTAKLLGNSFGEKHGKSTDSTYKIWRGMLSRCENINDAEYPEWGGRGINVCDEWHDFEAFYKDVGDRPHGTTLDRKDNNKGYCKDNCRWGTPKVQANNRRNNRLIEYMGRTQTLQQWADESNLRSGTLSNRLDNLHWTMGTALKTPLYTCKKVKK